MKLRPNPCWKIFMQSSDYEITANRNVFLREKVFLSDIVHKNWNYKIFLISTVNNDSHI